MSTNHHDEELDYKAIVTQLEKKLAVVEVKRANLQEEETALKSMITNANRLHQLGALSPLPTNDEERSQPVIPAHAFRKLIAVRAAEKYLDLMGEPKTHRELVEGMTKGGFKSKSKTVATTIRVALYRDMKTHDTFDFIDGKWGLQKWGRKPTKPIAENGQLELISPEGQ